LLNWTKSKTVSTFADLQDISIQKRPNDKVCHYYGKLKIPVTLSKKMNLLVPPRE
jgi:hypothetical protein